MALIRSLSVAVAAVFLMAMVVTNGSFFQNHHIARDFGEPLHIFSPPDEGRDCPEESDGQSLSDTDGTVYCYVGMTNPADGDGWQKMEYKWYGEKYNFGIRIVNILKNVYSSEIRHSSLPEGLIILNQLRYGDANDGYYNIFSLNCGDVKSISGNIRFLSDDVCSIDVPTAEENLRPSNSVSFDLVERSKFKIVAVKEDALRASGEEGKSQHLTKTEMENANKFVAIQLVRKKAQIYCLKYELEHCKVTDHGALVKLSHQDGWYYSDGRVAPREVWP